LTEIEAEKNKVDEEKSLNKTQQGTDLLIQFIPDNQADRRPIVKLSCEGQDNEGQTVLVFPGIEGVFTHLVALVKSLQARVLGVQYSYQEPEISVEKIAKTSLPVSYGILFDNYEHSFFSTSRKIYPKMNR
jgi:fatty acid synthase